MTNFKNNPKIIQGAINRPHFFETISGKKRFCDFSVDKFLKIYPDLKTPILEMVALLPKRQFITVKYTEQFFTPNDLKTCKDISFHVDGSGNDYALICWGEFRTLFLNEELSLDLGDSRLDVKSMNDQIKKKTLDLVSSMEVPDGEIVLYNSECIHKGRVSQPGSRRIFLRVCSSDYLYPKNYIE